MSLTDPIQKPPAEDAHSVHRPSVQARTAAVALLAVLITLFAVFNLDEVKVDWVFGSGKAPLIIVIVVSLLVGIALTYFADRRPRKRGKN